MKWTHLSNIIALLGALAPATSAQLESLDTQSAFSAPVLAPISGLSTPFAPLPLLPSPLTTGTVLSSYVLADIQKIVDENGLPGVSLAVVHHGGEKEFASFGVRTEDGDVMAADVRHPYLFSPSRREGKLKATLTAPRVRRH
jgi:hypothetical protein